MLVVILSDSFTMFESLFCKLQYCMYREIY